MRLTGLVAAIVAILMASPACAGLISNALNLPWASRRDLTSAQFSAWFNTYRNAGYRIVDVDAYPHGAGRLYGMVWERNDGRAWAEHRDMSASLYASRWQAYRAAGYRPHDFESYRSGSSQLYAGIWVRNIEGFGWSSQRDMTGSQYSAYFNEQRALGRRPVDIEVYPTSGGFRYAAIWYQNVGNVGWAQLRDMSRTTYQSQVGRLAAAGYRLIDFESYQTAAGQRYAAIWERNPAGRGWVARSDRTELGFANLWRQYRDEGYRLVDFERYDTSGGPRYAGIWVENDWRFDYPRKGAIDNLIVQYRAANNLPGISVAIIRNGLFLYRRGFGWADVNDARVAHGETVYNAASVAKVIGGTLAAKLEDERRLRDGTGVFLDLSLRTSAYLTNIAIGGG